MKTKIFISFALVLCNLSLALADEGMWMINTADKKAQEISKSIVSVDFMGTGSLVSPNGLVITNHHVAFGDIFSLSTPENNLLEKGFWTKSYEEEIPVPGRCMQLLVKTLDVTDEVNEMIANGTVKQGIMMMRKLSALIEKKYTEGTDLVGSLNSFWRGKKYYLALYKEYQDIRLVAAPPQNIGAYGGDIDNWEWPQHKGDFAFYRIYTAPDGSSATYSKDNVPLKNENYLKISTKGYSLGSKTMVIGFPGSTDRFASAAKVDYKVNVELPIVTETKGVQMDIIKKWMEKDETVRQKYADRFFSLSNAQEYYLGELQCYKRFDVVAEKRGFEKELNEWINADTGRIEKWGHLTSELDKKYAAIAEASRNLNAYRECLVRGTALSPICSRTASLRRSCNKQQCESVKNTGVRNYAGIDLRVERELFRYSLGYYFDNVKDELLGEYQKELKARFGKDYDAMCAFLWDKSWATDEEKIKVYLDPATDYSNMLDELTEDPLVRFFNDNKIVTFNTLVNKIQGKPSVGDLGKAYTHAIYEMKQAKKQPIYPDANSTMRITYGKVCSLSPRDAVFCSYSSTVAGLLEKDDPTSIDFHLEPEWKAALQTADPKMKVDFISDNDITGGNSGSPIMNSKGEIIGLAFDGNKESLAGEVSFTTAYNRCVNVDIRFVLWTIRNYGKDMRLFQELGF